MCCSCKILNFLWDIFLAIGGGIIASIMYDYFREKRAKQELENKYRYLLSKNMFDWKCYLVDNIDKLDEDSAYVKIIDINKNTLNYHHKLGDIVDYMGQIIMDDPTFGRQTFNYINGSFSGIRNIIVGEKKYNNKACDFIYIPADPMRGIRGNQIWLREKEANKIIE